MKAPGTITIEMAKGCFGGSAPGVFTCEKEDGKGTKEIIATTNSEGYVVTIPLTEDNLEIAKRFWLRRGCKVLVNHTPLVIPFKQEEYGAWELEDKKAVAKTEKEIKRLEAEIKKIQDSLPGLKDKYSTEIVMQTEKAHKANELRMPYPEKSVAFLKAESDFLSTEKKGKDLEAQVLELKQELL